MALIRHTQINTLQSPRQLILLTPHTFPFPSPFSLLKAAHLCQLPYQVLIVLLPILQPLQDIHHPFLFVCAVRRVGREVREDCFSVEGF
jgi:hypothetical protein